MGAGTGGGPGDGTGGGAGGADERLSFLGREVPGSFERRVVVIAPGTERRYDAAAWRGALVLVESGRIVLECADGGRREFGCGDLLWLDGLALRALRNPGRRPAVLVAVSRRERGDRPG